MGFLANSKMTPLAESNLDLMAELAVLLAAMRLDDPQGDRLKDTLQPDLDWPCLLDLANEHHVLPLLYHHLKEIDLDQVPAKALTQLKSQYWSIALRNQRLAQVMLDILGHLEKVGISTIPFKGLAMAANAYGDITLRQFMDIDLLIHESDCPQAFRLIRQLGFEPETRLDPEAERWMLRSAYHLRFKREADILEIHWTIAERSHIYPLQAEKLWKKTGQTILLNQPVTTLSLENTLIMACIHGASNQWHKLKWIADIAWLVKTNPNLDWDGLLSQVCSLGFSRLTLVGLSLATQVCGLSLPERVVQYCAADPQVAYLTGFVLGQMAKDSQDHGMLSNNRFYSQSRERWRDRLYYFYDQAFVPKQADWEMLRLHTNFYWLYYLLRPLRLTRKFSQILIPH